MTRYRMTVAYDGTAYAGWQIQPGNPTVQAALEAAVQGITGEAPKLHGSGRTDQGVHAHGQVAHFDLQKPLDCEVLLKGLNALLPADIRVFRVQRAAADFHARRSAVRKEYRYLIWNSRIPDPSLRLYRTHVRHPLDVQAMQAAARLLVGRHDFAAMAANPNREVGSTIRTLSRLSVTRRGHEILIRAESDGFLYKMVRSLAGLLIRVGEGAVPPRQVAEILASRLRTARVPTAPPEGLFLWKVWY